MGSLKGLIVGSLDSWMARPSNHQSTKPSNLFLPAFTLIEFLVVLGILALVVGSITLFLSSVLHGTNQANIQAEVKQNGQAVLDALERQIRGGSDAIEFNGDLAIIREDAKPLHIKCWGASGDTGDPSGKNARVGTVVSDRDQSLLLPSDYVSLSNDDPVSGVTITNCDFKVLAASFAGGANAPAVISLSFDALPPKDAPQREDYVASAHFQTTISLRTYR